MPPIGAARHNEPMTETSRQRRHRETMADILRIAHQQLVSEGAAALSLRAIARELGLVSSAMYRYVPSRDELLTLLIEESYNAFGDAVEAAESRCRRDDFGRRWLAIGRSVRRWAVANPAEWALLYGSPVPGYAAPDDTVTSAARVPLVLLTLAAEAHERGLTLTTASMPVPRKEHRALRGIRELTEFTIDDERLVRCLMAWENVFGHLSLELFGHMYRGVLDYDAHFEHVVDRLGNDLGLP